MQNQTADADEHRCAKSQTSPQVVAQTLRSEQAPPTPDHPTQPVRNDSQDAARTEAARVKAKFPERIDTARAITLRFDFGTNQDTRVAMLAVYLATVAGLVVLVVQTINVSTGDDSTRRFQHKTAYIWNICVGVICIAHITFILVACGQRAISAHNEGKRWEHKRKRIVILFAMEAAVHWVNLTFYIIPNVYLLRWPCYFYAPFLNWCAWVRWTCWNTLFMSFLLHAHGGRKFEINSQYSILLFGPWQLQWPCSIPWLALQVPITVGLLGLTMPGEQSKFAHEYAIPECEAGHIFTCTSPQQSSSVNVFIYLIVSLSGLCMVVTCLFIVWKIRELKQLPYQLAQTGALFFKLQLRLRVVVMTFFVLCLGLWLVHIHSCASNLFAWFGIMPMQIVMTANAFVWNWICMIKLRPEEAAALRVWEQEIAWTEADKEVKLEAKALTAAGNDKLLRQPIFCFETMMHMLYWSCLVYDYKRANAPRGSRHSRRSIGNQTAVNAPVQQAERTNLSLDVALASYHLTESELIWELALDTRCLMGWSNNAVVVAFRGTASITNAWLDLQFWRVAHSAARGHRFLMKQPLVHGGFMKSWLSGKFNEKVVSRVMKVANSCQHSQEPFKVYVTGHSLGGALATLAAYEISQHLQEKGRQEVQVVCYSFGAPRTGNHAFAQEYSKAVPDSWSIINDQDVVTRGGKFFFLYKRPGRRVIVNDAGRMVVCPSAIEASVHQDPAGHSVDHHFLSSYTHAILSVILAQFSPKGFSDGVQGIIRLAEASPYLKVLLETQMGMHVDDMKRFASSDPQSREHQTLPGSHLPARGFYRIKSASTNRQNTSYARWKLLLLSWLPFWSAVPQQPVDVSHAIDEAALTDSLAGPDQDASADGFALHTPP